MIKGITFCLSMLISWSAVAQLPNQLTFEEAVNIGLKNSVLLNQQRNTLEGVQAQKVSNMAGFGPTINAQAQAMQINGNFFNQQAGKLVNGLLDQVNASLNANITVFNGFSQIYRTKQSINLTEAQAFYINRTAQDVINSICLAYLQVLLDVELLKIAEENAVALNKQLDQVKEQVKLGAKSPVDQYNQDSQAKAADIRVLTAKINLMNDRATLTQILLKDPSENFDVVKPDWGGRLIKADSLSFNVLLETALQNRGDYQRALRNEEAARYGAKASRTSMMPNLSAFGTVYSAYNKQHGAPANPFSDQFTNSNLRKVYGISLNIPILGGNQVLQNRANYMVQRATYRNNIEIRKGVEAQVRTDVMRSYQNYLLYSQTFATSIDQLNAAKMAYQYETERYNLGVSSFVDFVNANKTFVQAQTDKAQAEYRLLFQKVVVDYAAGTLKIEDIQ